MAEPLVSIVLPTYNGARYLDEAIQSCLQQSYSRWELIIVDDASTDDTPERIAAYLGADRRIIAVRHEINRKLPGALNTGFALARGDYLTWTSDDNRYRPHALATLVEFLEKHPGTDLVYSDYCRVDAQGEPTGLTVAPPPEELLFGNCVGPSFLYRRAVHDTLGGYASDLFLIEDYEYWLRTSTRFRLAPLHQDLYLYRMHPASLTSRRQERIVALADRVLLHYLPRLTWADEAIKARAYLAVGLRLARSGADAALPCLDRALRDMRLLRNDPGFVVRELLYTSPTELRTAPEIEKLLTVIEERYPDGAGLGRRVWGQYHATRCYEARRDGRPEDAREHLPMAVRRDPSRLRDRGFMRLALWAYTHKPQGGTP
jgi:glycosyltransferase involved in cell wall biosynthesis